MTSDSNATPSAATVREHIRRAWDELQQVVGSLDDDRLAAPGPDGWSIKDHLAHLADWEEYLVAMVDGRRPDEALGLDLSATTTDEVNAQLQRRHVDRSPADVRSRLREVHARTVARLGELDDSDLARPLSAYLPWTTSADREGPIVDRVTGNTCEHYDEHRAWIKEMLAGTS